MAIITGWIFLQLDKSQAGIRSREGSLYTASSLNGYLVLTYETFRLTIDIRLFDRERTEGVVTVPGFLLSRRAARLLLEDLPAPVLFSIIFYFMVGYRLEVTAFFIFLAISILVHYIAVSFAAVGVGLSRTFSGAGLVANLSFTLQSFACGYFVQSDQIPVYTRWLKWTAYTFYAFGALCYNEFIGVDSPPYGQFYDCPSSQNPLDLACKQYTGQYIITSLGFPSDWIWRPCVILIGYVIGFYTLGGLLLQYNTFALDIAHARKSGDNQMGKEAVVTRSNQEIRRVDIDLDKYALEVKKQDLLWKRRRTIQILQPITTQFHAGQLNVIMGPSGSGKTSLLNSVARRLHGSMTTKYRLSGTMSYDGAIPKESVIRSVTSFVTQDDDALMPSLTVRESLYFAAGLRLPRWMSKQEKYRRAEDILLKMGLKDCADNLIGSDIVKGISGGEKRRVTIAIQILTDPKVLLLDEPTSGLDAFTATSIIEVLNNLAAEGRTLIMTIHQSRSNIFHNFSNILLLARGGYPVYAGRGADMIPYFSGLGYDCPSQTNPADFALDLITVDLQQEDREKTTRKRAQRLIDAWGKSETAIMRRTSQIATPAELGSLKRQMHPLHVTFPLVIHRSAINFFRQPDLIFARTSQIVGIAIIMALFFAPMKNDYAAVQTRMGFVQEFAALYFIGMLQNISVYPPERDVFYREEADHCYSAETFILSYTLLEIPFEILASIIFGIIAAYAVNMERSVLMLFVASFNCFAIINAGESLGIMFCTLFDHVGFSVNVTSVVLSISTIMGGIMSLNLNNVLQGFNHLSPIKYSVANLAVYSMRHQTFSCTEAERLPDGICPITTGHQALQLYNLDVNPGLNLLWLGIATVVYRFLAYLVVKGMATHGVWEGIRRAVRRNKNINSH
ncbi:hypothetical protein BGW36DRAFT_371135 [Talaromyces proteolyticus]|uniref:ABC transporter domain-containing protein n=1 Tax=Talaromyces proteolyticus TaxID=1131652 RepID=A0AAD4KUQ1_9EURO|nr:uncharacterized protein BGW36DRAFT_371135 [Talaromyces proteolyticus]KAH8701578.1 hypothetical protein BGW36DRAFT_371135 [Talaromyces proteolyticus]